jgi:hypothetical protein
MRSVTRLLITVCLAVGVGAGVAPSAGAAVPSSYCCDDGHGRTHPWDDPNNDNYFKTVCDRVWVPDHGYHRPAKRLNGHFETTNCRRVRREGVPIG